jgi:hypothetical protein
MSCAMPVMVPWPISARTMRTTTLSSGLIVTHTPSSGVDALCALALSGANGMPSANPPPAAAVPTTKERRSIFGTKFMCPSLTRSLRRESLHALAGTSRTGRYW